MRRNNQRPKQPQNNDIKNNPDSCTSNRFSFIANRGQSSASEQQRAEERRRRGGEEKRRGENERRGGEERGGQEEKRRGEAERGEERRGGGEESSRPAGIKPPALAAEEAGEPGSKSAGTHYAPVSLFKTTRLHLSVSNSAAHTQSAGRAHPPPSPGAHTDARQSLILLSWPGGRRDAITRTLWLALLALKGL